jgi:hypothetical protein
MAKVYPALNAQDGDPSIVGVLDELLERRSWAVVEDLPHATPAVVAVVAVAPAELVAVLGRVSKRRLVAVVDAASAEGRL